MAENVHIFRLITSCGIYMRFANGIQQPIQAGDEALINKYTHEARFVSSSGNGGSHYLVTTRENKFRRYKAERDVVEACEGLSLDKCLQLYFECMALKKRKDIVVVIK